jgi:CMP/dCMP kinase
VAGALRGVVALDGPSGTGKTTVARRLAERLSAGYLDTGAMYRVITLAVLRAGVDPADSAAVAATAAGTVFTIGTSSDRVSVTLAGEDVAAEIRGAEVNHAVSAVSAVPAVRELLVARQRRIIDEVVAETGGIVVEGRDIGTVIFPDARVKVWLTASAEARGRRRAIEHSDGAQPQESAVEGTVEQLARRDRLDSTRAASPLQCAQDAHVIDTTPMSAEQVIDAVLQLWDTVELPDADSVERPGADTPPTDNLQDSTSGAAR